jgi:uncharacterized protein
MTTTNSLLFKNFRSPTYGELDFEKVMDKFLGYLSADPSLEYELIIGTDSVNCASHSAEFVSALVVHRKNSGGIYFWSKQHETDIYSLRQRIFEEALLSLRLAEQLIEGLKKRDFFDFKLTIHVDVGPKGETKKLIQEVVGMIKGNGFDVKTKPEAYGASSVADRHT